MMDRIILCFMDFSTLQHLNRHTTGKVEPFRICSAQFGRNLGVVHPDKSLKIWEPISKSGQFEPKSAKIRLDKS